MATTNLKIGDSVTVPGQMYGTLKFVGPVAGKRGVFAGVQLAPEYAARGKNSGDVEGKHYFRTSMPGSGIFLPIDKAEKRQSGSSATNTPGGSLTNFNQGGRVPSVALPKPNFSQSVGPGRNASPTALKPMGRRESLPRPSSPLRRVNNATTALTPAAGRLGTPKTRPSLGFNRSAMGAPGAAGVAPKSPAARQPSRFGQSLRQSTRAQGSVTPNRARQPPSSTASVATSTTEEYSLGPESAFDESPPAGSGDDGLEHTPTPAVSRSFRPKLDVKKYEDEIKLLREQLDDRDRQIDGQSTSIAEMERSLQDLQTLIHNMDPAQSTHDRHSDDEENLPKDVQDLRSMLREKNDRIKAMTAEFDSNRADFRSTIDTLEMASSETERVYESRIDELLEEVKHLQDRSEDVEAVAQQFRQLEELVAELEEGLEDARRGEAEARGEVEFLRGEVERGRSELRREQDRSRAGDKLNGIDADGGAASSDEVDELHVKLDQKDDEIRGLKAIIQNMNNADISPMRNLRGSRMNGGPFSHGHSKTKSTNTVVSVGTVGEDTATHLQNQIRDLESLLQQKSTREEELKEEVTKLRQSVHFGSKFVVPGLEAKHQRTNSNLSRHRSVQSTQSTSTVTAARSSGSSFLRDHNAKSNTSQFVDAEQFHNSSDTNTKDLPIHEFPITGKTPRTPDAASISADTEASSNALYCEICEESGHDILTCGQMIGDASPNTPPKPAKSQQRDSARSLTTTKDSTRDSFRRSNESHGPPPDTTVPPPPVRTSTQPPASNKRGSLEDVVRPAPLSTSRQSSFVSTRSPLASPRKEKFAQSSFSIPEVEDKSSSNNITAVSTGATLTHSNSKASTAAATGGSTVKGSGGLIEGTGDQAGMLAGKESGIIDPDRWCALCERDGHESVDCPIEMDF